MSTGGRLVQISISAGGVPKLPVPSARVTESGVDGDAHRDHAHHGGPGRAVCLYAQEAIDALRAEGHTVAPGTLGENLTVAGLDWSAVSPGGRVRVGDSLLLEITRYTSPCFNIAPVFKDGKYGRVSQKLHPGWSRVYARVLVPGVIQAGDPVRVVAERETAAPPSPR